MATNLNMGFEIDDFKLDNNYKLRNKQIITDITEKKVTVLDVVESLELVITNEDKDTRRRSIEFLSWLLSELPQNFLAEKELTFFSAFYCDRLKDHHNVIPPVLQGIFSMVKMTNISENSTSQLLHNIFQFVTCQAQLTSDRYTLYQILKTCAQSHLTSVKTMGTDFMFGVIASMEGETDPRNLLLIFSFLPSLLSRLQIDDLTPDVFEVFSIYFPVDFTTVKKDGILITRDDLAGGLANCLTSTVKISAECLPMILEKLDSTLKTAKIDSYKLLQRCCERLESPHLEPYLNALWKMVQRDLLPPMDDAIQREGLLALGCLVGVLTNNNSETVLNHFLDDVIIGVRTLITTAEDSLFSPSMKILEALCMHSIIAARRVFLELEVLCRPKPRSNKELQVLIEALMPFMKFLHTGEPSLESLTTLCLESSKIDEEKVQNLAFSALQKIYSLLAGKWRLAVQEKLLSSFQRSQNSRNLSEGYKLLRLIGKINPEDVISNIYCPLENQLLAGEVSIEMFLDVSAAIVDIPLLSNRVLANYCKFVKMAEHSSLALQSLLSACRTTTQPSFVYSLYELVQSFVTFWQQEGTVTNVKPLSYLLKEVIACRNSAEQSQLLVSGHYQPLISAILENVRTDELVFLLEGLLGPLHADVKIECLELLLPQLIHFALTSKEQESKNCAGRLLANFGNKMTDDSDVDLLMDRVAAKLDDISINPESSVVLYAWVLKGVLLRGHSKLDTWLNQWFNLLNKPDSSRQIAISTGCLLKEESDFLNSHCHCTVRFLYRQRLFSHVPSLVEILTTITDKTIRNNYLLTLVQLASNVPQQVLKTEESSVSIIVSHAIQSTDSAVVLHALNLLNNILVEMSEILVNRVMTLIPNLLLLSTLPSHLNVRRLALQCIYLIGCFSPQVTLPCRAMVVRALIPCLDDRKRIVRVEAARARSRWFLIGQAGGDAIFSS